MKTPPSPIPAELRAAREAAGLTQAEAAALLYLAARTWQDWERGITAMPPDRWEHWRERVAGNGE